MKKLPLILALALTVTAFTGCGSTQKQEAPKTLVISNWGLNADLYNKNVFKPFEDANNVKIVIESGNNSERLTKLKNNPNSNVDIMYLAESYSAQGIKDGLFEKIDYSKIPNAQKVISKAKHFIDEGYGPAYTLNRAAIIYNPKKVSAPITSWKDLWNPALKGKISIPDIATTFGPAMVHAAALKAGTDIKSDNGDAAFKELAALKPNVVKTYSQSSDLANMFANGEITAAVTADFAYGTIKKAAPDVVFADPQEGAYLNFNTINIVKGSKNKDLALKFINYALSAEVQTRTAKTVGEAPVNEDVKLTSDETKYLTYGDNVSKSNIIDYNFVNPLMKTWIDKWNRLLNK